jgi:hypothetical protein
MINPRLQSAEPANNAPPIEAMTKTSQQNLRKRCQDDPRTVGDAIMKIAFRPQSVRKPRRPLMPPTIAINGIRVSVPTLVPAIAPYMSVRPTKAKTNTGCANEDPIADCVELAPFIS